MDYNSKGWQAFRRRVPHKVRLVLGMVFLAATLPPVLLIYSLVHGGRVTIGELNSKMHEFLYYYWQRGSK